MRKLPIGITDYKSLIEGQFAYVDKTLFIQEVIQFGSAAIHITRPKRFGKTLNLSMLKYFFEKTDRDESHLFKDFNIWKTIDRKEQGQYPVIFLSLKDIHGSTWEETYEKFKELIAKEFERHRFLLNASYSEPLPQLKKSGEPLLSLQEKKFFQSILNKEGGETVFYRSLYKLTFLLNRYYRKNVVVLIDDYDSPIQAACLNSFYESLDNFMRGWLGAGLKDNTCLEKAVLTGVLEVSAENFFSGSNICSNTLFDDHFCDKFGFLEEEVLSLLKEHHTPYNQEEIKSW